MEALLWHLFNYFIYTVCLFVFTLGRETPYDAEREKRPFALSPTSFPSSLLVMRKKRPAAARRYEYTGGAKKSLGKQKFANFGTYLLRNQNNGWNMDSFHTEAWGKVLQSKIEIASKKTPLGSFLPKKVQISKKCSKCLGKFFLGASGSFQVYLVPPVCH